MGREAKLYFEVAFSRCRSVRLAVSALEFLVGWGRGSDMLGESFEFVEQYAEFVGCSRAQGFRRQAAFRRCFPADDIAEMWAIVKTVLDSETPFAKSKSFTVQAMIVGTFRWNP